MLLIPFNIQSGAADHSLGFEDEDLRSSPGWWAATVATYCPSRPGELLKSSSSKPSERSAAPLYLPWYLHCFGLSLSWHGIRKSVHFAQIQNVV